VTATGAADRFIADLLDFRGMPGGAFFEMTDCGATAQRIPKFRISRR
jgi:hypothetical protein